VLGHGNGRKLQLVLGFGKEVTYVNSSNKQETNKEWGKKPSEQGDGPATGKKHGLNRFSGDIPPGMLSREKNKEGGPIISVAR